MIATAALCLLGHCMAAPAKEEASTTSKTSTKKASPPPMSPPPRPASIASRDDETSSPSTPLSPAAFPPNSFDDRTSAAHVPRAAAVSRSHRTDSSEEEANTTRNESACVTIAPDSKSIIRKRAERWRHRRSALRKRIRLAAKRFSSAHDDRVREHVTRELDDQQFLSHFDALSRLHSMCDATKGDLRIACHELRTRWKRQEVREGGDDDDETESSSGEEEESVVAGWNSTLAQPAAASTPTAAASRETERKRALLRAARTELIRRRWDEDRACIGAHWQLLHSRISDLEYRIRKQSELCDKLDAEKVQVLYEKPSSAVEPSLIPSGRGEDEKQDERKVVPINGSSMVLLIVKHREGMQCARAVPLKSAPRRRIIRGNLTWRHGNEDDVAVGARRPVNVQLSNLDYSFHPRLSLLTDSPLPLLLHASLRHERWQVAKAVKRKSRSFAASAGKRSFLSSSASAAMLQYEKNQSLSAPSTPHVRSNSVLGTRLCQSELRRRATISEGDSLSTSFPGGGLKRRRSSAFDINAIVIPNSFFATTRVEKIHYEEIVTPKWRSISSGSESKSKSKSKSKSNSSLNGIDCEEGDEADEEFEEDMSDEAFRARHSRAEALEKKRYMSWMKKPPSNSTSTNASNNHKTPSSSAAAATATTSPASPVAINPENTLISVGEPLTLKDLNNGRGYQSSYRQWLQSRGNRSDTFTWPRREFPISDATYRAMLLSNQIQVQELLSTRAKNYGVLGLAMAEEERSSGEAKQNGTGTLPSSPLAANSRRQNCNHNKVDDDCEAAKIGSILPVAATAAALAKKRGSSEEKEEEKSNGVSAEGEKTSASGSLPSTTANAGSVVIKLTKR